MANQTCTFVDASGETRLIGTLNTSGTGSGNLAQATITTGAVTALVPATGLNIGAATDVLGFYAHAGIAQQTGVAVSAAGIHAALVALGLITA